MVNVFVYFWKPNSLFSKSCVNCLLMFYFVYCINCVLNDVNGACWCTCSLVALCVPEMSFWPLKTRENIEHFEMHTCLWPGPQICFRHKWRNWLHLLFYFIVLIGIVASVIGMSLFQLCSGFYIEVFSYCNLTETFAIWFQKWFGREWIDFGVFCWKMASSVDLLSLWTKFCQKCSIVIPLMTSVFFDV